MQQQFSFFCLFVRIVVLFIKVVQMDGWVYDSVSEWLMPKSVDMSTDLFAMRCVYIYIQANQTTPSSFRDMYTLYNRARVFANGGRASAVCCMYLYIPLTRKISNK